jgi:hypothetical protein
MLVNACSVLQRRVVKLGCDSEIREMLGAAFLFLGVGLMAVFQPAMAAPVFDALHLHNYQAEIGAALVAFGISLFIKKLVT